MKLAITQIVLGVLIVFFSFYIVAEGYVTEFTVPLPGPVPQGVAPFITVNKTPGLFTGLAIFATCILGLAVMGTGIIQLLKARRKQI
jgi:hypothetical protein